MSKMDLNSEAGIYLLEVLVAAGLLGMAVLANSNVLTGFMRSQKNTSLVGVREQIIARMRGVLVNEENILASAEISPMANSGLLNDQLKDCLSSFNPCSVVGASKQVQIAFAVPEYPSASLRTFNYLAPVSYNSKGTAIRSRLDGDAVFKTEVYFWATCPLDVVTGLPQSSCIGIEGLNFRFRVVAARPEYKFLEYPDEAEFNDPAQPHRYALHVSGQAIRRYTEQNCPLGYHFKGFSSSEFKAQCECDGEALLDARGQVVINGLGLPTCVGYQCPNLSFPTGMENGRVICQERKVSCRSQSRVSEGGTIMCDQGEGGYIYGYIAMNCQYDTALGTGKKVGDGLRCDQDVVDCCYPDGYGARVSAIMRR